MNSVAHSASTASAKAENQPDALRLATEAAEPWANVDDYWPLPESDGGEMVLGAIEEGEKFELLIIDADTYGTDGESEKLARFYAAANPGAVLALLDERDDLAARVAALNAAGPAAENDPDDTDGEWRRLALQFDGHRMQALSHLRTLLAHPQEHSQAAAQFLTAPPLSGEALLAQRLAALAAPQAEQPSTPDQKRSDLVPGVMHCAKCKFQLNRITLCVSDGNAYAGDSKTEPCPNGCGPLWPVTWEQEARSCWKALEEMHDKLQAATQASARKGGQ